MAPRASINHLPAPKIPAWKSGRLARSLPGLLASATLLLGSIALAPLSAQQAPVIRVFHVRETAGIRRTTYPVTVTFQLPKGALPDAAHARVMTNSAEVPAQFTARALAPTYAFQAIGAALLAYGLVRLDVTDTIAGIVILQTAKAWYLDRQVLLFEDMKTRHPQYARWEY